MPDEMKKSHEKRFEDYWVNRQSPLPQKSKDPDVQKVIRIIKDKDTPHEVADRCLLLFCPADIIIAWRKRRFFQDAQT